MAFIEDHLERHLGKMADGLGPFDSGGQEFSIARFPDQPCEGATSHVTLGLGHHPLLQEELMVSCWDRWSEEAPSLLVGAGAEVLRLHDPLRWGEYVDFGRPLIAGATCTGLLGYQPTQFPDDLAIFDHRGPPIHLVWLVPLLPSELEICEGTGGVDELLDLFVAKSPDLLDFGRQST